MTAPTTSQPEGEAPLLLDAQSIVDSADVLGVYAACEWSDLGEDGHAWLRAIVKETARRCSLTQFPAEASGPLREAVHRAARTLQLNGLHEAAQRLRAALASAPATPEATTTVELRASVIRAALWFAQDAEEMEDREIKGDGKALNDALTALSDAEDAHEMLELAGLGLREVTQPQTAAGEEEGREASEDG